MALPPLTIWQQNKTSSLPVANVCLFTPWLNWFMIRVVVTSFNIFICNSNFVKISFNAFILFLGEILRNAARPARPVAQQPNKRPTPRVSRTCRSGRQSITRRRVWSGMECWAAFSLRWLLWARDLARCQPIISVAASCWHVASRLNRQAESNPSSSIVLILSFFYILLLLLCSSDKEM